MPARGRRIYPTECIIVSPPTINHLISHRRNERERERYRMRWMMTKRTGCPSFLLALYARRQWMNVHAPSDDLNIRFYKLRLVIPVSAFSFFRTHTGIPKKYMYTVNTERERPREKRLPRARYLPQQRVICYTSRVWNIARNLSELPRRIPLTRYARATVNDGTKFHCDRSTLFFRTWGLSHVHGMHVLEIGDEGPCTVAFRNWKISEKKEKRLDIIP